MNSKYNKYPSVQMPDNSECFIGWKLILNQIQSELRKNQNSKKIIVVEYYHGVNEQEFFKEFVAPLKPDVHIDANQAMLSEEIIKDRVYPDVTDDEIFGYMTRLNLENFFDNNKIDQLNEKINKKKEGVILVTGIGASIVCKKWDTLIYADMARWEI